MPNPARKAVYCLLVLLAGVGLIRMGVTSGLRVGELRVGEHWTAIVPLLFGFVASPSRSSL